MALTHARPSASWIRLLVVVALLAAYLPATVPAAAIVTGETIHVDFVNGDDDAGDGSAEDPFKTITRGVSVAESGDTVLVAPGVYTVEYEVYPIMLPSGVTVKSSAGAEQTIVDGGYYESVFAAIGANNILLEGFTIQRGGQFTGGGMYLDDANEVTLRSLEVTGNLALAGAGLAAGGSNVNIEDCTFASNGWIPDDAMLKSLPETVKSSVDPDAEVVTAAGGAILAEGGSLTISGGSFVDNGAAMVGGAVALAGCDVAIDDTLFQGNILTGDELALVGAIEELPMKLAVVSGDSSGGGLYLQECDAVVTRTQFRENQALFGGAMQADPLCDLALSDSLFERNFALAGAFTYMSSDVGSAGASVKPQVLEPAAPLVDRCVFRENEGLMVSTVAAPEAPVKVQNSLFTGNIDGGYTVWFNSPDSVLVNSTLAGNTTLGSAIGPCEVVNTISWGNDFGGSGPSSKASKADEIPAEIQKTFTATGSLGDFPDCSVTYSDCQSSVEGTGNISADPLFADIQADDFRLSAGSPALDAGTHVGAPPYDLDNLARPVDGDGDGAEEFDMGAYETGAVIERLAGADRYETAVEISRSRFDAAGTVVLATGRVFADGLSGAGLAGALDAPLLLTRPLEVPSVVKQEIARLGAKRVIVLGGPSAVSERVVTALKGMGVTVERIGGYDRYETAAMIAFRIIEETGDRFSGLVFVARGDLFPDALSVSPAAYALGAPILLVMPDEMPASTVDVFDVLLEADIVIAGGDKAVSPAVAEDIPELKARVSGADRYATAAAFSRYAAEQGWTSFTSTGIATGDDFADALAGGVAMGSDGGVLLLTPRNSLHPATAEALGDHARSIFSLDVFGGPNAVNESVRSAMLDALQADR